MKTHCIDQSVFKMSNLLEILKMFNITSKYFYIFYLTLTYKYLTYKLIRAYTRDFLSCSSYWYYSSMLQVIVRLNF